MRALVAAVLLFLLNLQPLAGAAFCVYHHDMQGGAACATAGGGAMEGHHKAPAVNESGMPPMGDECASAAACATPAPVVAGAVATLDFETPLHLASIPSLTSPRAEVPSAPLFRPPIT